MNEMKCTTYQSYQGSEVNLGYLNSYWQAIVQRYDEKCFLSFLPVCFFQQKALISLQTPNGAI